MKLSLKKQIILIGSAMMFIVLVYCAVLYTSTVKIKKYSPGVNTNSAVMVIKTLDTEHRVVYDLEKVKKDGNYILISGYGYMSDECIRNIECKIILRNKKDHTSYQIPTKIDIREDINQKLLPADKLKEKFAYLKCGFHGLVNVKQIKKPLKDYLICIDYQYNDHTFVIETGKDIVTDFGSEKKNG